MRSSFLPFHQPLIDADDERAVLETLRSGWLTTGPRTKAFEKDLAAYTRAAHCVAVNSCTAALHLALEAVGVGAGDDVITSPITFASTANVIVHRGARPVFVDVEPDTFNIDAAAVERALTPRTKALLPVDFAGQPCDLDAIMAIGARHRIPVIEDAAHAIGAEYKGRRIGGVADMTCFSFYATKNITSGEGGALTTNRQDWADRIAVMALHGISRDAWKRYGNEGYQHWDIIAPGYKYNMFDLQAALVRSQFNKMEAFYSRRVALKQRLDAGLRDLPEIVLPAERPWALHAYHLYPILVQTERLVGGSRHHHERDSGGECRDRRPLPRRTSASLLCRDVRVPPRHVSDCRGILGPDDIAPALSEDDRPGRRRCRCGGAEGSVALPPVAVAKRKNRE